MILDRAALPVGTVSTRKPFFRKPGIKDGPSARFPSIHNILAFMNGCPLIIFKAQGKLSEQFALDLVRRIIHGILRIHKVLMGDFLTINPESP
jgi:hypothetical protein